MFLVADYVNQKNSLVDTVLNALENHDVHLFVRLRSAAVKENAVNSVKNMWQRASEQSGENVAQIRRRIENALCETELTEYELCSSHNLFRKIVCHWRLFFQKAATISLEDFLAWHIAENGNSFNEYEELIIRLQQRILTVDDLNFLFDALPTRKAAPQSFTVNASLLTVEDVPYLTYFCHEAKKRNYSSTMLLDAWKKMLDMKSRNVDCSKWENSLLPEQALFVLFGNLSYEETTKHSCIFLNLIEEMN